MLLSSAELSILRFVFVSATERVAPTYSRRMVVVFVVVVAVIVVAAVDAIFMGLILATTR